MTNEAESASEVVTCIRCGTSVNVVTATAEGWNIVFDHGFQIGYLCGADQTAEENAEAVINEATEDYFSWTTVRVGDRGYETIAPQATAKAIAVYARQAFESALHRVIESGHTLELSELVEQVFDDMPAHLKPTHPMGVEAAKTFFGETFGDWLTQGPGNEPED